VYGSCQPPPDEGGCSPPLQVQNHSACEFNPVGLDVAPHGIRRFRGAAIAWSHEAAGVNVSAGRSTAVVYAWTDRRAERAARALRRVGQPGPRPLPAPVFPRAVLAELKRVVVARRELESTVAVGYALGIPRRFVRARLDVARVLPPGALRGVRVPRRSWPEVQRDRQIAFAAETGDAQRRFDLTREQVRRAVRRVRGLVGKC
jgi:hypothetical protein